MRRPQRASRARGAHRASRCVACAPSSRCVACAPQACNEPLEYRKGCRLPGASNFDGAALQSGVCHYRTAGCTDSAAINYVSEATLDDGSCILPTWGCTLPVAGYALVDPATPGYKSLQVGLPTVGLIPSPEHKSVLAQTPAANSIAGCVVAIEGCLASCAAEPHGGGAASPDAHVPVPSVLLSAPLTPP